MKVVIDENGITIIIDYDTLGAIIEVVTEMIQDEEFLSGIMTEIANMVEKSSK
jgi:hypothetical protein